jgi:hypothetical protein
VKPNAKVMQQLLDHSQTFSDNKDLCSQQMMPKALQGDKISCTVAINVISEWINICAAFQGPTLKSGPATSTEVAVHYNSSTMQ